MTTESNPLAPTVNRSCRVTRRERVMVLPRTLLVPYLLLFVMALIVYPLLWPEAPASSPDTAGYLRAARAIASGTFTEFQERTPGYPLMLLATGSLEAPTRLLFYVSLILYVISVYMVATVLHSVGVSRPLLVGFGVIMLLPPYVQITPFALSETCTAFCLAAGFSMLYFYLTTQRRSLLIGASIATAYAALTRPLFEFLAIPLAIVLILSSLLSKEKTIWKRAAKDCLLLLSAPIVAVGGYCLFNYVKFDHFGMTPLFGYALTTRTSRLWEEIPNPKVRSILVESRNAAFAHGQSPAWSLYPAQERLVAATGRSDVELGKDLQKYSLFLIRSHPEIYVEEVLRSFTEFWFPPTSSVRTMRSARSRILWYALHWTVLAAFLLALALYTGSALLAILSGRVPQLLNTRATMGWLIAVGVLLYTAAVSSGVSSGDVRYRQPADLLLLAAAAIGVKTAADLAVRRRDAESEPRPTDRRDPDVIL